MQPIMDQEGVEAQVVEVPDEEVVTPITNLSNLTPDALVQVRVMLDQHAAILNEPLPPEVDFLELTAEYLERLEAVDLRAQIRQEQGRLV